jgi:hypothetical protein
MQLGIREITEHTMQTLGERLQKQIAWVASVHDDHTPLRHAHGVAVLPRKLNTPDLQFLTQKATDASLEQRRELDLAREQKQKEREREEEEWEREY